MDEQVDIEQPNTNSVLISAIQGLTHQISEKIAKIQEIDYNQKSIKDKAFKEINLFESTTLHEMQGVFE